MKKCTLLLSLFLTLSPALAQGTAPSPVVTAPAAGLPDHPRLRTVLTVTLPTGTPLPTVLTAIARASGLTLLTRDVPGVPVTLSVKGLTARAALSRLLNLYGDQVGATLEGNTLIVAPPSVIARLTAPRNTTREVLTSTFSETVAARVGALTGANVTPLETSTVVSGTPAQVAEAAGLLRREAQSNVAAPDTARGHQELGALDPELTAKTLREVHGVTVTIAYGRVYLAGPPANVEAALATLARMRADANAAATAASARPVGTPAPSAGTPAPSTTKRTIVTSLPNDLVTRLKDAVTPGLTLVRLDGGTYLARGTAADLDEFQAALRDAQARDALRVTVTYPEAEAMLPGLVATVPTVQARAVSGGLEVRGTLDEQVRVSAYLQQGLRTRPAPEQTTSATVRLAYASPAVVAAQLLALYAAEGGAPATPAAALGQPPAAPAVTQTAPGPSAPTGTGIAQTSGAAQGVRVVSDERTRSVLLTGPEGVIARMQRTAGDLDRKLADIRMNLRIEQLSGSDGQNLGVNWKVGLGGFTVGQTGGSLSVGYAPTSSPLTLEATLNAARSQGRSTTLLDTTFVAQDGRASVFKNGGQLLLPNYTSSTGGGQTTTSTSRETYEYGLDVTLTPRLAPDGTVELAVTVRLGDKPVFGAQDSVQIESQTLTTVATVTPGETLVLGGVITTGSSATKRGVPVLSELPLIGPLFGTKSNATTQGVLLISLTAADRGSEGAPAVPKAGAGVTRLTLPGTGR